MLIDGEKYACEACVRGHRVSNCQHSDRPLQHINKKGRPVSQCQHCRAMRKSRSSHVKCDCGEKTHKCAHLKQTLEGHKDSCCCNHGGRCTCSHKKEPSLDTVPESDLSDDASSAAAAATAKPKPAPRRRRTNTAHSEPILSFDENGHHRPAPRHSKASQKSGPYASLARGSSSSSSSSSMRRTGSASSLGAKSRTTGSSSPERITKSVQASPSISSSSSSSSSSFAHLNGQLPPLDLSKIQYQEYSSTTSTSSSTFDLFGGVSADYEPPMFSAGLSAASVDWAQYDGLESSSTSFDQAHSYLGGLDFGGNNGGSTEPTLTSNSGDVSETEDFVSAFSESQFDGFRGSYLGGGMLASGGGSANAADLSNLDFDNFKATSKLLSTQSSFDDGSSAVFPPWVDDEACWGMNNFTDGITHSPDPVASGLWDTA